MSDFTTFLRDRGRGSQQYRVGDWVRVIGDEGDGTVPFVGEVGEIHKVFAIESASVYYVRIFDTTTGEFKPIDLNGCTHCLGSNLEPYMRVKVEVSKDKQALIEKYSKK